MSAPFIWGCFHCCQQPTFSTNNKQCNQWCYLGEKWKSGVWIPAHLWVNLLQTNKPCQGSGLLNRINLPAYKACVISTGWRGLPWMCIVKSSWHGLSRRWLLLWLRGVSLPALAAALMLKGPERRKQAVLSWYARGKSGEVFWTRASQQRP